MKKDDFYAKIAFYLSLGFWIPMFNVALCIISIVFATTSVRNIMREPKKYSGLYFAIVALVLSITAIITTAIFFVLYLMSDKICSTALCQS